MPKTFKWRPNFDTAQADEIIGREHKKVMYFAALLDIVWSLIR